VVVPPAKPGSKYWSVTGDPIVKTLGGKAETLANVNGEYVLMETKDGSYAVTHEIAEDPGTAASRRDHRNGAHAQAVAVRQDGNTIVFRNQRNATTKGGTVNHLEINGQTIDLADLRRQGTIALRGGGQVRWTAPSGQIKEGTIRIVSSQGDVVRIEDMGRWIDLYGTPGANRRTGELAGLAGALDPAGPGFFRRIGTAAGWSVVKRVAPDQDGDRHADASLLDSWRARGSEAMLDW
jgi:hypothetical protein